MLGEKELANFIEIREQLTGVHLFSRRKARTTSQHCKFESVPQSLDLHHSIC